MDEEEYETLSSGHDRVVLFKKCKAAMVTYTRSAQEQASQNSCINEGEAHAPSTS